MESTTQTIPAARREAYQTAAETTPFFAFMMILFAILLIGILYFFNKKFKSLPTPFKTFFQVVIVVGVLVTGIFVTAYGTGTESKLFALLPVASSTRASSDVLQTPFDMVGAPDKNSISLQWKPDASTSSSMYLVTWSKNIKYSPLQTRITTTPTILLEGLDAGTEYKIEVQGMLTNGEEQRFSRPVEVKIRTLE